MTALHSMQLHVYTSDIQVYISITVSDVAAAVQTFEYCISAINDWMCVTCD